MESSIKSVSNLIVDVNEESLYKRQVKKFISLGQSTNLTEDPENFVLRVRHWEKIFPDQYKGLSHIDYLHNPPESQCGADDRIEVKTTDSPFKMICKLIIADRYNNHFTGSGFFISKRCVITSGHCVYFNNNWAKSITVIPGFYADIMPFGSLTSQSFRTVSGWINHNYVDHDHGAIILPDDSLYNKIGGYFGFKIFEKESLINNSGYPGDKEKGQWYDAGEVNEETTHRLFYMMDTHAGSSGSPIFIKKENRRFVVGVHGYGGCPNSCVKVNSEVYKLWAAWSKL